MSWDVLVIVVLMAFGAVSTIAIFGMIGWAIFFLQNVDEDNE
jgi:hypothetical protein